MRTNRHILFYFIIIAVCVNGCKNINPSIMFKTKKDYKFTPIPENIASEFKLSPNDNFTFQMFTNDGFKLVDLSTIEAGGRTTAQVVQQFYTVEPDGYVKLPIVGRVNLTGKTIREAELFLEDLYSKDYKKPFVILTVSNKRVFVFPGSGSVARTIYLKNNNTTLIEVISEAGGLTNTGKAFRIKVIRGNLTKEPAVYNIDLSKIEGIKYAGMIMQNNDIVYVEPIPLLAQNIVSQVAPYITLLSSVVILFTFYRTIK